MSRRRVLVALIFTGTVISYVDRGNLSIAAASMMRDFGISPAQMGLLLSVFYLVYGACQVPAGAVVDRFGSRRVLAAAFLLWSLASAGVALSRTVGDILVLRALLGVAEAVGPLACLSLIRKHFKKHEQGAPVAIYTSAQNVGPAIGALAGTFLLDRFGWRPMFAITGLSAMFWLPLWVWLAPPDSPRLPGGHRLQAARRGALPWRRIVACPAFWTMPAALFLLSYAFGFILTWVPTYLTAARGFSTLEMGRMLSVAFFAMAVASIATGALADRLIRRTGSVFRVRLTCAALGMAGASSTLLLPVVPQRAAMLPILTFSMCSMGVAISNFWAISQYTAPRNMVGRTIGFLNTISQCAGAMAPIVTGWLIGPAKRFETAIVVCGVFQLLACAFLFLTGPGRLEHIKSLMSDGYSQGVHTPPATRSRRLRAPASECEGS